MAELTQLKQWRDLAPGGTVLPAEAEQPHTGGWRTGVKPSVALSSCVNCLLCWLHCPDSAVRLSATETPAFDGFDLDFCKGCEICAEVCPVDAISMVSEDTVLPEHGILP